MISKRNAKFRLYFTEGVIAVTAVAAFKASRPNNRERNFFMMQSERLPVTARFLLFAGGAKTEKRVDDKLGNQVARADAVAVSSSASKEACCKAFAFYKQDRA